jgi:hypothetical protein
MVLAETQAVPMKADRDGVIRVGGIRVRLETIICAFHEGWHWFSLMGILFPL